MSNWTRDDLKTALGVFASAADKNKEMVDDNVIGVLKKIAAILSLKSSGKMTAIGFASQLESIETIDLDKAVNVLNWIIDNEATVREKDLDTKLSASLKKLQTRPMLLEGIVTFIL